MSLGLARPELESELDFYQIETESLAAHECGHAVCALANGVEVVKIQNGLRRQFTIYDKRTFPEDFHVRKVIHAAGGVAANDFLAQLGLSAVSALSAGDAAHILGYEEHFQRNAPDFYNAMINYENVSEIARVQNSLNDYLSLGKELPCEFQHLLGVLKEARSTLMEHRNAHTSLIAALSDKGGVLRKRDIQRIWQAHKPAKEIGENDFPAVTDHTEGAAHARQ